VPLLFVFFYVALDLVGVVDPLHQKGTLVPVFLDPKRFVSRMTYHFFLIQDRRHVLLIMDMLVISGSSYFVLLLLHLPQLF
jgi:hypothetical protein